MALQEVQPSEEVRSAFIDVMRARQDKATIINQARGYGNTAVPQARLEAQQIIESAETTRDIRLVSAEEDARRFLSILMQYNQEEDDGFKELCLEAMEEILPGVAAFIVAGVQSKNSGGDNLGASQQYFSMVVLNPATGGSSSPKGIASSSTTGTRAHSALGSTSPEKLLDDRLFLVAPPPVETRDIDAESLAVHAYAVIRIVEPAQIADMAGAVSRLEDIINSSLRYEIAQRNSHELIGADAIRDQDGVPVFDEDGIVMVQATRSRSEIMGRVLSQVNTSINEIDLGVEVVDLRLRNVRFPEPVVHAIFERMRSEQEAIARRFRIEGEDLATEIRADIDRRNAVMLEEAQREATAITGEGEIAIINAILEVLTRDPELFVYEKAFLAYKVSRGLNN